MQSTQHHYLFNQKTRKQKSNFNFNSRFLVKRAFCVSGFNQRFKKSALKVSKSTQFTFLNVSFDKGRLKNFVWWFFKNYGQKKTIQLLEEFKTLGFAYATQGGISLGIDDLQIPPTKSELLLKADRQIDDSLFHYERGEITGIERFQNLIDTWHQTSETLKQEVIHYFEMSDIFNPVYMMAFSGARGNISQVRQLVGMRGLMADPQGQIIDFPIRSNFREGLTLTEYIISTYGARKGIVDTALRTATAGYLTRRLVDVAQHVVVSQFDCGTTRGIFLFDMKEGLKTLYSFKDRLIGRVVAQDLLISEQDAQRLLGHAKPHRTSNESMDEDSQKKLRILAYRNQEIGSELAHSISQISKKALVRSTLTCDTRKLVCQLCYGWSLAKGRLVSLGDAVGIIAAQSIGEPGTQLTMRTFHTGGVFSGGISDQILAPSDGTISYLQPIPGTCIRTPQGQIAFLTKAPGSFIFHFQTELETLAGAQKCSALSASANGESKKQEIYQIPAYTILFARNKQNVLKKETLAQLSAISKQQAIQADAEQMIYAGLEGQVYFSHLNLIEQSHEKHGDITWKTEDWSKIWILSGKIYENPMISSFFPVGGDLVNQNTILNDINWWTSEKCLLDIESLSSKEQLKPFSSDKGVALRAETPFLGLVDNDNLSKSRPGVNILVKKRFVQNRGLNSFVKKQYSLTSTNKFQLKIQITSNRISELTFKNLGPTNCQTFGELNVPKFSSKSHSSLRIQNRKLIKFSFPFYYPFQQISKRRFFQFLYANSNSQSTKQIPFWIARKESIVVVNRIDKNKEHSTVDTGLETGYGSLSRELTIALASANGRSALSASAIGESESQLAQKKIIGTFKTKQKENGSLLISPKKLLKKLPKIAIAQLQKKWKPWQIRSKIQLFIVRKTINSKIYMSTFEKEKDQQILIKWNHAHPKKRFFPHYKRSRKSDFSFRKSLSKFSSLKSVTQPKKLFQFVLKSSDCQIRNWNFYTHKNSSELKHLNHKRSEPSFQNPSFLMKQSIFQLNIQKILYKQFSYKFILDDSTSHWNPLKQVSQSSDDFSNSPLADADSAEHPSMEIVPYFALNPNFFLELNVKKSQYSVQKSFSPSASIQTRAINNRYLNCYNSFSWTTFAHDFFAYFPKSGQSFNNGIFYQSHELKNQLQKQTFKYKSIFKPQTKNSFIQEIDILKRKVMRKSCLPSLQLRNSESQLFYFLFENSQLQTNKHCKELSSLAIGRKPKRSVPFTLPIEFAKSYKADAGLGETALQKDLGFSKCQTMSSFYNIEPGENTLRWKNATKNDKLNKRELSFKKYTVSFNEFFWLPQENYKFCTLSSIETNFPNLDVQWKNQFVCKQQPIFQLLSNQGLKKEVQSNLEGIVHYSKRNIQTKAKFRNLLTFSQYQKQVLWSQKFQEIEFLNKGPSAIGRGPKRRVPFTLPIELAKSYKAKGTGNHALNKINQLLQSRFLLAISKIKRRGPNSFFDIFQQKSQNRLLLTTKPPLFGTHYYSRKEIQLFPISTEMIPRGLTTRNQIEIHKNPWISLNPTKNSLQLEKIHMTVKQGWIYCFNNMKQFNIGHQFLVNPGISFLDNVCFNHQAVFIELLQPLNDSNSLNSPPFQSKKTIQNLNSRFGIPDFSNNRFVKFLIRPLSFHILENAEKTKFSLFNFTSKQGDDSFSFLKFKKFSSNLLNQQKVTFKLFPSFPFPDIQVQSMYKRRDYRLGEQTSLSQKNMLGGSLVLQQVDTKSPIHKKDFKNGVHRKLISIYRKSYQRNYSSFISMYSLNFCPLSIKGAISYDSKAPFQIPLVQLLDFQSKFLQCTTNFNSFNRIQKQLLKFLIWKTTFENQFLIFQKEEKIPSSFHLSMEILKTIGSTLPIPTLIASYSQKMNCFYNQRFLNYSHLTNTLKLHKNDFQTSISTMSSQLLHSFPILKNQLFVYSNGQAFPFQPIGKTSTLSPLEGEVIDSNCWAYGSDQVFDNEKSLFLTKSDVTSVNFVDSLSLDLSEISTSILNTQSKFDSYFNRSKQKTLHSLYEKLKSRHNLLKQLEYQHHQKLQNSNWEIQRFELKYQNKIYTIKGFQLGFPSSTQKFRLGRFLIPGERLFNNSGIVDSGQIIHLSAKELTLRYAQCLSASPNGILHTYNGDFIQKNHPIMTLPFQTLKTGDIVQGIPKVEQYLEARTTQQGRLYVRSLPVLIQAIFERYCLILPRETAVRQSFLKIQQILVDGVQRVYRSQGISIADKHLEVIVKQMASKVQIVFGGQTGFFPGELVDLDFVERINRKVLVKVHYEPVILGITRASLEVDSFLSAASFQQTTKILARAAIYKQKDYLKGLKENLLIGNLLPAGTGFFSKITRAIPSSSQEIKSN